MPSTQLINISVSQTFYLRSDMASTRIWLAGNGTSAYTVKSATLNKGTASASVKVNGQTSFQVPAMGRWSDYVSLTGFALPGNATLTSVMLGSAPIVMLPGDSDVGWDVGVSDGTDAAGPLNLDGLILLDSYMSGLVVVAPHPLIEIGGWETWDDGEEGEHKAAANGVFNTGVQPDGASSSSAFCRVSSKSVKFTIEIEGQFDSPQDGEYTIYYAPITGRTVSMTFTQATSQKLRFEFNGVLYGGTVKTFVNDVYTSSSSYTLEYNGGWPAGLVYVHVTCKTAHGAEGSPVIGTLSHIKIINGVPGDIKRTEVTSSETISVSDNTQIEDGDTLTNNVGSIPVVYTFRNLPTGAANEIIIGGTAAITSANIAAALNATEGAIFTAVDHPVPEKGFEWALNIEYTTDDTIIRNNNIAYTCISAHTAASTNEPGVGTDWETFWTALGLCTDWSGGVLFAASGETSFVMCAHNGFVFVCISEHTSATSNEPLSGVDWETCWLNSTFPVVVYPTTPYISVTEYTSETVTKSTTSAGVAIGSVTQSVLYTTPDPVATLPAFTGNGFCDDGTAFLPAFTAAGTCTQDDFCIGRGVLPATTCNAQSFISGLNYDSTKPEKISLLLNGNGFMQSFAPMVCVTDPDEAALLAVQFVANYITYTADVIVWGTTESWVCPRGTLYYAQGDCEDGSFLIASLLLNIGVSSSKVKVAIGYYDDTGHAWAMYQRASDDNWVNLDWTKGSTYWNAISSVDELPIAFSEA